MDHRWYVVHVYSGFENKVAQSIREQADRTGVGPDIEEVLVPTEEVLEVKRGAKSMAERKFFPGYVLVKMRMTDHAWHLVKNTSKVTGFLGAGKRPSPISEAEARRIVDQTTDAAERPKPSVRFEIGEQVRVSDGRSPASTASSRTSTRRGPGSRSRSRSSAARRRSTSSTDRSKKFSDRPGSGRGRSDVGSG